MNTVGMFPMFLFSLLARSEKNQIVIISTLAASGILQLIERDLLNLYAFTYTFITSISAVELVSELLSF